MCHENRILTEIDTITRDGLSEILNLMFTDDQWLQAGLPVKDGGLGVRSVATLALAQAFVGGRLDYCNSILYCVSEDLLRRLQSVQNAAARFINGARKYDHTSPVLRDLHLFYFILFYSFFTFKKAQQIMYNI